MAPKIANVVRAVKNKMVATKKRRVETPPSDDEGSECEEARREAMRPQVPSPTIEPTSAEMNRASLKFGKEKKKVLDSWSGYKVLTSKFVDQKFCAKIGIWESVAVKARRSGWESFLTWKVPTYEELTREFLATLEVLEDGELLYFRLCNRLFLLEKEQLDDIFGFAEENERDKLIWSTWETQELWKAMTGSKIIRTMNYASKLPAEECDLYYIQRVLSNSLFCRATGVEKISTKELRILYAMKNGMQAPWREMVWEHIKDLTTQARSVIGCGAIVTQLAISLPLHTQRKMWATEATLSSAIDKRRVETVTAKGSTRLRLLEKEVDYPGSTKKMEAVTYEQMREAEEAGEEEEEEGEASGEPYLSTRQLVEQLSMDCQDHRTRQEECWATYRADRRADLAYQQEMTTKVNHLTEVGERNERQMMDLMALIRANFPQHGGPSTSQQTEPLHDDSDTGTSPLD